VQVGAAVSPNWWQAQTGGPSAWAQLHGSCLHWCQQAKALQFQGSDRNHCMPAHLKLNVAPVMPSVMQHLCRPAEWGNQAGRDTACMHTPKLLS
jgi:hypothetical protein